MTDPTYALKSVGTLRQRYTRVGFDQRGVRSICFLSCSAERLLSDMGQSLWGLPHIVFWPRGRGEEKMFIFQKNVD